MGGLSNGPIPNLLATSKIGGRKVHHLHFEQRYPDVSIDRIQNSFVQITKSAAGHQVKYVTFVSSFIAIVAMTLSVILN